MTEEEKREKYIKRDTDPWMIGITARVVEIERVLHEIAPDIKVIKDTLTTIRGIGKLWKFIVAVVGAVGVYHIVAELTFQGWKLFSAV